MNTQVQPQGGEGEVNVSHSADWPHLDPVIRPIAAQDDLARAHHILKDLYVSHPPAQYVERQIEQLIRLPRRIRMPGLFLCGDSGMGKTHLLRRVERRHPEYDDAETKRHIRPVLYVQVPAAPTVRSLRRTLIDEANIPFLDHPSRPLPESIVRRGLAAAGTQLIVLDEIHNIEHMKWNQRVLLRDWVRCLSNSTQRPIVLSGTEEFESAILGDRQMASRYPIVRLARWSVGPDLAAFLSGYERACPLRLASRLTDAQFMRALLDETDGITDSIVRSLQAAALVAIREGTERITAEQLSWWRDPPLLTHYGESNEAGPGTELARAWLRDHRQEVQPNLRSGSAKFRNRAVISTERAPCNGPL
jgi:Bacterial TniB protein